MYTRTLSALAAVGLTFATLSLATPLHAAPVDRESVVVPIGDLDLSTDRGAAKLERRIVQAAREICGWFPRQQLRMKAKADGCVDEVAANARGQADLAIASSRAPVRVAFRVAR